MYIKIILKMPQNAEDLHGACYQACTDVCFLSTFFLFFVTFFVTFSAGGGVGYRKRLVESSLLNFLIKNCLSLSFFSIFVSLCV